MTAQAHADSADDYERIYEFLCEKDRSTKFLKKFANIQDRYPTTFRPSTLQPNRAARDLLYGDPELNNRTRKLMCADQDTYNDTVRNILHDNQGPTTNDTDTEAELAKFYDDKIDDFNKAIEEEESS